MIAGFVVDRQADVASAYVNGGLEKNVNVDPTGECANSDSLYIGKTGDNKYYTKMTLQLLIIIPAALDSGLIKYLSAFPFSERIWEF